MAYIILFLGLLLAKACVAPPVTQNKEHGGNQQEDSNVGGLEDYMEYHRYLKEVVNALESDPEFRQKLEKADESEIKSGKIADELQFVSHHVRSRLDEIKRLELQRLKELTEKKLRLEQDTNSIDQDPTHHHLDQHNPHTFEIEDLKKLIAKTTEDLAEADKKRKEEFKRYEMEKEYLKQDKLNHTNGEERSKLEKTYIEMEEKHKKHEKLHEPGHKAQLEEVWEEQDQMQQDFDPKTFFMLHDVDGNGLWDQEEVKALFIKELDKMYQQGAPEDDMKERFEEMERMRESVFREMDHNRDGFIDFMEFLQQTNTNDFKQDNGWESLDQQTRPYTDEELYEYINKNHLGPAPGPYYHVPPGHQQIPSNQQFYPGQVPQMAPQQLQLNTNEVYQHQQQVPQQQFNHPGQGYQPNYQQPQAPPQQPQYQQAQHRQINKQPPNLPQNQQPQYQQPNPPSNQQPQYQQPNPPPNQQPQYQQQQPNPSSNQQPHYQEPNPPPNQQINQQPQYQQQVNPQPIQQQPNQGQQSVNANQPPLPSNPQVRNIANQQTNSGKAQ